jgi:spoIIIJ-associated protein
MTEVTIKGRTVDQAIEKALYELGTTREQVEVKVLAVGSDGILGLLGLQRAKVRVTLREDPKVRASYFLEGLLEKMGVKAEVSSRETQDAVWLEVETGDEGGLLIGHRGQTLQAIQLITERAAHDGDMQDRRLIVDVNRYLREREQKLVDQAKSLASRAISEGKPLRTEPLGDGERMIVHHALRSDERVVTRSVGNGALRPVLVSPKGMEGRRSGGGSRGRGGSGRPRRRSRGRGRSGDGGRGGGNRGGGGRNGGNRGGGSRGSQASSKN